MPQVSDPRIEIETARAVEHQTKSTSRRFASLDGSR